MACTCPAASTARQSSANSNYYCIPNAACTSSPCSAAASYSFISTRGSYAVPTSSPYNTISYTAFPFLSFNLNRVRGRAHYAGSFAAPGLTTAHGEASGARRAQYCKVTSFKLSLTVTASYGTASATAQNAGGLFTTFGFVQDSW